jgi:tetratricopeptide (TPR) repeat protein
MIKGCLQMQCDDALVVLPQAANSVRRLPMFEDLKEHILPYREAIKEHHEAISLSEEEDERLFISLGSILYEDRQYSQSVKAFQEGIRIAGRVDADYSMMLADALLANKQIKLACAEWKRALESQSRYGDKKEIAAEAHRMIATHCR